MFLVELVMQGVRGIRDVARIRFKSGFNVIAGGNESGKTASVDATLRLLFPGSHSALLGGLVSRFTPDASRAALVAYADDGAYYRVLQDFSKQAVNLSKYNAGTKEFALLHKDWDSAAQFMGAMTGGISEEEYAALFVFGRDRQHRNGESPAPAAALRRSGRVPAPAANTAAQEARLEGLRDALRKAEEAADADYAFQSAKLRVEELRKKLESVEELDGRRAEIEASLETYQGCETLPQDIREMLDEHEQRQGEKMSKVDELTRDIEQMQSQLDSMPRVNIVTDKLFLLGVLIGILSVVAGLFVLTTEQAHFFPLGVLVALAVVSISWYKSSIRSTQRKTLTKEIEALQGELQELEKSFEQGGATIAECMKTTGSTTAAELREKAENYQYFLTLRNEIEEQRGRLLGSGGDVQSEYQTATQEMLEREQKAAALSEYAIDTYSIRQDIERLESELGQGAGAGADFGFGGQDLDGIGFASPAGDGAGKGLITELAIASRISAIEIETLVPAVEAAAQRNLAAVTAGRYVRIEAAQEGDPVVHAKDDSVVRFSELSHGTKELVFFCLRTGLAEALAGKRRLPVILDDPLACFDSARQQAACQILRTLGAKTQVILFTSNPSLKSAGDAVAELK